ncbi:MAG: hypothetical protein IT285_07345 [Bdellovibrionales bacterium]|nr:hypothetical protein [Bdellovibrionales bacterium]
MLIAAPQATAPEAPNEDTSTTRIQPGRRKAVKLPELGKWTAAQLKGNPDPMAQALGKLLTQGVTSALYLPMKPPPAGQKVPYFEGSAFIGSPFKERVWRGLKWDPKVVPQLWNVFLKTGLVELTPPGNHTVATSNRNVVRAAFGISLEEYLILVRVGSLKACRGVLALVSQQSVLREVEALVSTLEAPVPAVKKSA